MCEPPLLTNRSGSAALMRWIFPLAVIMKISSSSVTRAMPMTCPLRSHFERFAARPPMPKGEVWEEYTNQVDSVTDGFVGCMALF